MVRKRYPSVFAALLGLSIASGSAQTAAVRGVVRNTDGVPQMGVVVELLGADAHVVANAFTDLNGRFALHQLTPGTYQLRATAALYLPALRSRLQLRPGDLPTVNLMLSGLFEQAWPTRATSRGDLPDDWRWTLRSSANRPLLRVLDDGSEIRSEMAPARYAARAGADYASAGFGTTGTQASAVLQRVAGDESSTSFVRLASVERGNGPGGVDAVGGLERHSAQGLVRKTAMRLQSRPGIVLNGSASELLVAEATAGERMPIGDIGELQSGALLRAVHLGQATSVQSHPFLVLQTAQIGSWNFVYSLASDPDCQGIDDVGGENRPYRFGAVGGGVRQERNLHQSVSAKARMGRAVLTASLLHDARQNVVLAGSRHTGSGAPSSANGVAGISAGDLIDPVSGSFLVVRNGFSSEGWVLGVSYPVGQSSKIFVQGGDDVALASEHSHAKVGPATQLMPQRTPFLKGSVQTTLWRTGTRLRATYAWQSDHVVSVVAPYTQNGEGAYLSLHVRQPLRAGSFFPEGAVFTLDGENVLREGYVAVASAETEPAAALAGTLRTFQAGLAFTF